MHKILLAAVFIAVIPLRAQEPVLEWAGGFEGKGPAFSTSIAVDDSNNLYVAGNFQNETDFDIHLSERFFESDRGTSIFVSKYSAVGELVWVAQIGGPIGEGYGAIKFSDICVDREGSVFVAGNFWGKHDFDPSPFTSYYAKADALKETFVCKLNPHGSLSWVKQFKGRPYKTNDPFSLWLAAVVDQTHNSINSVKVDLAGNVVLCGTFSDSIDFDPGPDSSFLTTKKKFTASFVCKLNSSGELLFVREFGESPTAYALQHTLDDSGNIYVRSEYYDSIDFENGKHILTSKIGAVFILKLNPSGNFVWAQQFEYESWGTWFNARITVDNENCVLLSGHFNGNIDVNPGHKRTIIKSRSKSLCVMKLNPNGELCWSKTMGDGYIGVSNITTDTFNNIYIAGFFDGTCDFDPSWKKSEFYGGFGVDGFLLKMNSKGKTLWVAHHKEYCGDDIAIGGNGSIYMTGVFSYTVDFDPSSNTKELTARDVDDTFIVKFKEGKSNTKNKP